MSEPSSRAPLLWALLILPVAAGAGLLIGTADPPPAPPAPPAPVVAAPAAARAVKAPAASPSAARPAPPPAPAAPVVTVSSWTGYASAMGESQRSGKPVLLDFSADWCPPCRNMKRDVFDHASLGRAVQTAVIPVAVVDRRRETGSNTSEVEDLQRRYDVNAFPTLVVVSGQTGRWRKSVGYPGPDATRSWIEGAAAEVR